MTAACVAGPKYWVSIPGEPAPEAETCVADIELRYCWSAITSAPVEPSERSRVKAGQAPPVEPVVVVVTVPVVAWPLRAAVTLFIVPWSAPKDARRETMD